MIGMSARNTEWVGPDELNICVSYRDTQRYFYITQLRHCRFIHIDPDVNVAYDGQKAEAKYERR